LTRASNSAFYKDLQAFNLDLQPLGPNYLRTAARADQDRLWTVKDSDA